MGVATRDCPYCKTKHVAFNSVADWKTQSGKSRALFRCGSCLEGVIWEYSTASGQHPMGSNGEVRQFHIVLGEQWPKPESGAAPQDTPASVASYFEQGTSSLEAGNFDSAGMMFRKTLESATRILDTNLSKIPLVKRIENLAAGGKITADLAQWAHEVRLGGNEAAHDEEPFSLEDCRDLCNFIENFLRYAFTLPSAVKRRSATPVENVDEN